MRVFFMLILVFLFTSCDKIPFLKKQELQKLDTIVDFTSVDLSPSFKECDSIVSKVKKSECFRTTIHEKIGEELLSHKLSTKDSINEIILVDLIINTKGKVHLVQLNSSENIKDKLPELDSILKLSVNKLPKLYPAIKRGIPVTSKYQLPIQITLKD